MTPLVQVPAVPETNSKGLAAIEQANAFDIDAPGALMALDSFCVALKMLDKEIDAAYDEHIDAAYKAHKALVAKKKQYAEPNLVAYKIAKGKIGQIRDRDAAIAEQNAAIARAEAQKKAEDEALARAARAEEFGDAATAEAIISAPVITTPAPAYVAPKTQTVLSTRWEAVIEDIKLVPREYLTPDMPMLNGIARSTKGAIKIPGVRFTSRKV